MGPLVMTVRDVKRTRIPILALLLAASMLLGGCVYVRLVRIKHQLAEVEKTVTLGNRDGLTLSFGEPVLLPEDILYIARRGPSQAGNRDDPVRWVYRFSKQGRKTVRSSGRFDVPVELFFTGGRLSGGRLPERFGRFLDVRFVQETLRAIGRARVEIKPRTVCARIPVERSEAGPVFLPSKQAVIDLFGRPYQRVDRTDALKLVYRYTLDPAYGAPRRGTSRAEVSFTFLRGSGRLLGVRARFAGITLLLEYPLEGSPRPS